MDHDVSVTDLSVVIVNYNSAGYIARLLETLREDGFTVDGRPGRFEVVIVDNASRAEDHRLLESFQAPDVRLVRNTENVGYALGNNQGFHVTRSRWHLVSNPDVQIMPGCLQVLIDAVESLPGAAIVGPLATMDAEGDVFMPPNELPDLYSETLTQLSRFVPEIARFHARRRSRYAFDYWTAQDPLPLPMLSGSFFLGRRETFEQHGLFDPSYPLYYEDTDLFRRYHERDLKLWQVPAARIVHHFSRSAINRMKASMYRNQVASRIYFKKHFGTSGGRAHRALMERVERLARDSESPFALEAVPPSPDAPKLPVPNVEGVFLEVAGNPQFTLAVGLFPPAGRDFVFPSGFWDQLGPNHYWVRLVDPANFETVKAWMITKT